MSAVKVSNLETDGMAVNQLMGFFELNLVFGFVAKFKCAVKCSLCLGFNNIIATIGFINQHFDTCRGDFNNTAANSIVVEVTTSATLLLANSNRTRHSHTHQWFMARKNGNLAVGSRQYHLIDIFINFCAKESNKL